MLNLLTQKLKQNYLLLLLYQSKPEEKEKSKLASILLDNLQNNTSLAYGVGYRKMKSNLAQKNWPTLLAEMKQKSKSPKLK